MKTVLVALLLAIASLPGLAQQPAALVDGVQMPAWLERGGRKTPLVAGMELRAGDRITTGDGSRVLMKLAEGSMVKLGENGTLRISEIQSGTVFRAALEVLQGAFRFTTDIVSKSRKREVSVGLEQVTIGIRGTDLWGRARDDTEIVCLIEGAIDVAAPGEPPVTMDQPRQFYRRAAGQTQPVGLVEPAQLQRWADETEIQAGRGAARRGGRYQVHLARLESQDAALALYDQVRAAGYAAEIRPMRREAGMVYIVRIRNLPARSEAQALANQLRGQHGVDDPTVPRLTAQ